MDKSLSSLSDGRITSLITKSITDMVRQEVSKIMQELNMPVCTEAIDRIIAENLDKEVEKQNFVKTYKRKLDQLDQYKCIEKRIDCEDWLISNLQAIESRVTKLEDFVLQNLKQRPQLMQDLADRSRESLVLPEKRQRAIDQTKCEESQLLEKKSNENPTETQKPTLSLNDVMKVIKECPEAQNSFHIFQSAAEHIKNDLERFIQNYKMDFNNKALTTAVTATGRKDLEIKKIACHKSSDTSDLKQYESSKNIKVIKAGPKFDDYVIESLESVAIVTTGFDSCKETRNSEHDTDSNDDAIDAKPTVINMREKIKKDAMEVTKDLQSEKLQAELKIVKERGDENRIDQHVLVTTMDCAGKRIVDFKETKLLKTTKPQKELKNDVHKISRLPRNEKECRPCKECKEHMHLIRERARSYSIDEDIKWKLDKILDHIGDFCSRTRGGGGTGAGRECVSESDRKTILKNAKHQQHSNAIGSTPQKREVPHMCEGKPRIATSNTTNSLQQHQDHHQHQHLQQTQPKILTDLTKNKLTKSGSVKPKQVQNIVCRATALNGNYDRKNLDRILDEIRHTGQKIKQGQEVIVATDAKPTLTISINNNNKAQSAKCKLHKSMEQQRKSVEAFKTKWRLEYSKNSLATKNTPKVTIAPRNATEAIPKAVIKKRPAIPLPQLQHTNKNPVQKSSTTLMLESIDQLARSAAARTARLARAGHLQDDVGWVYSKRPAPQAPKVKLSEVHGTKVLFHNYKI